MGSTINGYEIGVVTAIVGAIAVFTAALIAGGVGLFGHLVARSNTKLQVKISQETARQSNDLARLNAKLSASLTANIKLAEMRQAWINNLREEMVDFQVRCSAMGLTAKPEFEAIWRSGTKIELHMNPADIDYERLVSAMKAYVKPDLTVEQRRVANDDFVHTCQRILKREWDVLKTEVKSVSSSQ